MIGLNLLKASNGAGNAVLAIIQTNRNIGATVLDVNSVVNWPSEFICTTGTLLGTNFLNPSTVTEFRGHLNAGDIIIDGFEPGHVDNGNTANQVAMVKQTTGWADSLIDTLRVSLNDNGTIKNDAITTENQFTDNVDPVKRSDETDFDFIASGGVITGDSYGSNRNASMTAIVAYINGQRGVINAVAGRTYTASKDTYVDILNTAGVFSLVYSEVANNAASPALAANSIRLGIVVTGAGNIANAGSINQGEINKVLPIASSIPYAVVDSLGNLICNRTPNPQYIGYRQILSPFTTTTVNSFVDVTGLSVTVNVPAGRKVKITAFARRMASSGGNALHIAIYEGATQLAEAVASPPSAGAAVPAMVVANPPAPSAGVHTYKVQTEQETAGTLTFDAASTQPAFISVELV